MNGKKKLFVLLLLIVAASALLVAPASAGHRHHARGGIYWNSWYPSPYYPWGWGAWGGWGWGGGVVVYPNSSFRHGALDLDVSPEQAEIYVDGNLVGRADDFDGFPDYLWLEKGTYDVVIYLEGYQTIARQYSIYQGMVIDVEDRMTPGEAIRPESLVSKRTVNREERLRRDRENEDEWRRSQTWEDDQGVVEPRQPERRTQEFDARGEPGRLVLRVEPGDATVYLDGRFLGTGDELSRLRSGLILDPGEHRLEVVRPGLEQKSKSFTVAAGEELRVVLDLERE